MLRERAAVWLESVALAVRQLCAADGPVCCIFKGAGLCCVVHLRHAIASGAALQQEQGPARAWQALLPFLSGSLTDTGWCLPHSV